MAGAARTAPPAGPAAKPFLMHFALKLQPLVEMASRNFCYSEIRCNKVFFSEFRGEDDVPKIGSTHVTTNTVFCRRRRRLLMLETTAINHVFSILQSASVRVTSANN